MMFKVKINVLLLLCSFFCFEDILILTCGFSAQIEMQNLIRTVILMQDLLFSDLPTMRGT